MSYFSQMAGLTVQNFLSAGVGIVVAVALIRGIIGRSGKSLGNFWHDLVRTSCTCCCRSRSSIALILVSQGVIQNFSLYLTATRHHRACTQTIAMGPVASQEAIKELGTNGGGFFNTNSAHPFENPTGFTQPRRDAGRADHPRGAGLHVRPDDRQPPPGLRDLRDDDDHVPRRGVRRLHRRGARVARPARGRPAHGRRSTAPPAATWRARSSASGSPARRCSTSSRRSPRAARSTARSSRSPGSAAPCRSRTCRPAR